MKNYLILVGLIVASLAGRISAQSASEPEISVMGTGHVKVVADQVAIVFTLKAVGKTLEEAFENSAKQLDTIQRGLADVGLSKEEVAVSTFRSEENEGNKAFLSSRRDYRTVADVTITTQKLDLIERIIARLNQYPIERIMSIDFGIVDVERALRQALKRATESAIESADSVATTVKAKRGDIISVEEIPERTSDERFPYANRASGYVIIGKRNIGGYDGYFEHSSLVVSPEVFDLYAHARVRFKLEQEQ